MYNNNSMKNLYVIADWADDDLSCAEVKIAILGYLKTGNLPNITFIKSTPSTIHTAFLIEQIYHDITYFSQPEETVIFQNTDSRINNEIFSQNPWNGKLILLKLKNGIWVFGPNAGYDFSLVKSEIGQTFFYPNFEKGGQFRSRDLYARLCAHLIEYETEALDLQEVNTDPIPSLAGFYIGHIDNFGNIKTTIKKSVLKGKREFGEKLKVKINEISHELTFVEGLFRYKPNELIIYPGSSGYRDDPYLEISVWRYFDNKERNGTGSSYFKNPLPGDKVELLL